MMDAPLDRLLSLNLDTDATYRGGTLSNHAPMALTALAELGASEAHLERFWSTYAARLDPFDPAADGPVPRDELLGELRAVGVDAFLRRHLAIGVNGLGGDAFHGWIRTAYAVRRLEGLRGGAFQVDGDVDVAEREVAQAVGYLRRCAFVPDLSEASPPTPDARALYAELLTLPLSPREAGLITPQMATAMRDPKVARLASRYAPASLDLAAIARIALENYLACGDFTSLHIVTGAHASRVLLPWVDPIALSKHTWAAVVAALAIVQPKRWQGPVPESPPWSDIVALAAASLDDHVPKLVWTCREEAKAYGNDAEYRFAAARVAAT
jgi:hypothetical protein